MSPTLARNGFEAHAGEVRAAKTIMFGVFKRNGHVYTEIVQDGKKKTLIAVVRGRVDLDSVIHSDGWRAYDSLPDLGYEKHYLSIMGIMNLQRVGVILKVSNRSGRLQNYA